MVGQVRTPDGDGDYRDAGTSEETMGENAATWTR